MSAELIGILSVGVALAALHMASIKGLREDMNARIQGLRDDTNISIRGFREDMNASIRGLREDMNASIKGFREDMNASIKGLREDMKSMENRLDSLEQRMARLEGVLDGLREALFERARERVSE